MADRKLDLVMRYRHHGAVDHVAKIVSGQGWRAFESPLPVVVASLSRMSNSCFLDIGANSGFYALIAQQMGSHKIFAYEPVSYIAEALGMNATLTLKCPENRLPEKGFQIVRKAMGSKPGNTTIYLPPQGHGLLETSASLNPHFKAQHGATEDVEVTTIDHEYRTYGWSTKQAWMIKIDVESWEEEVIRGGMQFVDDARPIIICEILPLPGVTTSFFSSFCHRNNYDSYQLCHPRRVRKVTKENYFDNNAPTGDWNYLFIPADKSGDCLSLLRLSGLDVQ